MSTEVKQNTAVLAITLASILGFVAGREYMKYEIRTAMQDAFSNAFK
jgi:hypothetical protein